MLGLAHTEYHFPCTFDVVDKELSSLTFHKGHKISYELTWSHLRCLIFPQLYNSLILLEG